MFTLMNETKVLFEFGIRGGGSMNTDTGEVKQIPENKKLKPPWIPIKQPNPKCPRCKGKGSVLNGNRKQRRHNLIPMHYIPCPDCSGKK